ncbi:GH23521 [Drosophila grimshawi]|uniref:GH23521 n=1 Tax=Drosophila grimshawi TaxID=7222 RepID=B4K4B1_DROGR|nr:GH23521 [Drosophila grimshawi]
MHRKSIEAQSTLKDDSGVSDHEDSAGSKSVHSDELRSHSRALSSSTESLNVVSPAPSSCPTSASTAPPTSTTPHGSSGYAAASSAATTPTGATTNSSNSPTQPPPPPALRESTPFAVASRVHFAFIKRLLTNKGQN